MGTPYVEFGWRSAQARESSSYVVPKLLDLAGPLPARTRVLDVGCGNGAMTEVFSARGWQVVGIDASEEGIAIARKAFPEHRFEVRPVTSNLLQELGEDPFDLVVSTEVIEHLYAPQDLARGCFSALRPSGRLILSTPYHGYLKNVAVAVTGNFDRHVHPLIQGGHVKFWSRRTLGKLLIDTGFQDIHFRGAGRIPFLWKSMLMSGDRP